MYRTIAVRDNPKHNPLPNLKADIMPNNENTTTPITGYRKLSEADIELMNIVKGLAPDIHKVIAAVGASNNAAYDAVQRKRFDAEAGKTVNPDVYRRIIAECNAEEDRLRRAEPGRWISIARTHFQEGLMALTRAVAQPEDPI